jgi:hypothetical protein
MHQVCGELQIKGGIIFEKTQETILNQDYAYFTRTLDTSTLIPLMDMLKNSMEIYNKVCRKANSAIEHKNTKNTLEAEKLEVISIPSDMPHVIKELSTIFAIPNSNMRDSELICKKYNATLTEVRTQDDLFALKKLCKQRNIKDVVSNIRYDSQFARFYYQSDFSSVTDTPFAQFSYYDHSVKNYKYTDWTLNQNLNQAVKNDAPKKVVLYANCNASIEPYLATIYNNEQDVVCEKKHTFKKQFQLDDYQIALYKWVSHNCKKDTMSLQSHIDHTIREIEHITSSKLNSNKNFLMQSLLPHIAQTETILPKIIQSDFETFQSDQPYFESEAKANYTNTTNEFEIFGNISKEEIRKDIISILNITNGVITIKDIHKYLQLHTYNETRHK